MFKLFVCKGLLSLFYATSLQRTAALVFCYWFANNCCPCLPLYVCEGPRPHLQLFVHSCSPCLPVSFAKDCCPYFCFCLQRIMVLIICYLFVKDASLISAICSQRTASLFTCFICKGLLFLFPLLFTKDRDLVFCHSFAKDCALSCAIYL